MSNLELAIAEDDPLLQADFAKEMLRQMRALDSYDMYENWSAARILSPFVLTKERRAEIPLIGDPDEITIARLKAYYNALSFLIEKATGFMAVPMVNLSHEGFGRVIISVGKLIVMDKNLRDVHRFGFKTFEQMNEEATKLVDKAIAMAEKYPEVAKL